MTLEQLEALRAARLDPADLPHTTTQRQATAYAAQTATLDHRITTAKSALATLAELSDDADVAWLDHLNTWRKVLCDELLTIKSPIRDKQEMGRNINLTLSIKCIDFGAGVLKDSGRELTNLRLGELMVASGFEVIGADPDRNFAGRLEWHGSLKETEQRMKETARRRAQAEQQLASALMDDDERAKQDAHSKRLRDAANALDIRIAADGSLRVFRNNEALDDATLTELQREAMAFTRRAFATSA